jgi:adenylate cyclase
LFSEYYLPHMAATRRLSAILAADVADYSRLMGTDEEGTLARLNAHRGELIDPKIREHRGRIVKTTGDGALVEFASVVDAVRCAVEVQRGMVEREPELSDDRRIRLRIGINLGDILVERGDIFGDGVNVAARLEGLAEPGGICISRFVRNQIRDKLPYEFEDRGEQIVKNIARPVRVDAMSLAAIAETPLVPVKQQSRLAIRWRAATALGCVLAPLVAGLVGWRLWPAPGPASAPRMSVAVLPLTNLSNDPEQDYFVDAITDDLTTDLSRIDGSFVISRTTAFAYKGKPIDTKQIGHDLGVRYVLEGSVRPLDEQVEVNVQLIDATSGAHVWADRFDTDRSNLAAAQNDIVGRLAHALDRALTQAAGSQIADEKNPNARDLVLRGWALYYGPVAKWPDAQHAFEEALQLDPESIAAKIGLATVLVVDVNRGVSKSRDRDLAQAEKLALEAVDRNPTSAQAYFALGVTHRAQNRLAESRTELEKAIANDRNHVGAVLQLGITLLFSGEPEAALPYLERALRLNPGSADIHFFYYWIGLDYLLMNQIDLAVDYFRKACAALPQSGPYRLHLAGALGLKGDIDEAKMELAEAVTLRPEYSSMAKLLNSANFHVGSPKYLAMREKTLEAGLRRAGMSDE